MPDRKADPAPGVLVVEDHDLVRTLMAEVVRGAGCAVATAVTADAALALLDDARTGAAIGVLLTDLQLPGPLSGFALARAARRRRPDLKILLTGADVGELEPAAWRAVADGVLKKPFTVDQLEACLAALLGARRASGQKD
jgi:CheY-like chemotaxis protein